MINMINLLKCVLNYCEVTKVSCSDQKSLINQIANNLCDFCGSNSRTIQIYISEDPCTMKESEYLQSSCVANCVCNAFLYYTTILLNSVTIHALRKTSSLPKSLKTLLMSLAVSDLAMKLEEKPENSPSFHTT